MHKQKVDEGKLEFGSLVLLCVAFLEADSDVILATELIGFSL